MPDPDQQRHPCGAAVEALRRNLRLAGRPTLNTLDRLSRRLEGQRVHGVTVIGVPRSTLSDLFTLVPARRPRREKVESVWAVIHAHALDKGQDVSAMVSLDELRDLYDRCVPAEAVHTEDAPADPSTAGGGIAWDDAAWDGKAWDGAGRSVPPRPRAFPVHRDADHVAPAWHAASAPSASLVTTRPWPDAPPVTASGSGWSPGQVLADAELRADHAWWRAYDDVVASHAALYLTLEPELADIRVFAPARVPDLLLAADYARHAILLDTPDIDPDELRRRVELLAFRQDVLHRPRPPRLWAIIARRALTLDVGDVAARRAQLRHLIGMAGRPGVTVQVLDDEETGSAVVDGAVTVMRFPDRDRPDLVRVEQPGTAMYPAEPGVISHFVAQHGRLLIRAHPPERTPPLLHALLGDPA
ncbi:DUF5753 domain-containing protein [Actinomadura harenae]|uniref:DUF5753 domain-containing protein n=1 Tax=Actinomadura harenae TaxID=2483351 RepID=A0A3M2L675_9ACTN|nr:DUF5753 domain-containing protein [Actinomadura harenae]RMI33121.1 hypothetical protein EBO15_41685 [Actinomadura harenae]